MKRTHIKPCKLLICTFTDPFLKDIVAHFKAQGHKIKWFKGGSPQQLDHALNWADLAFFEWCESMVPMATQGTKRCRMVCRLHSYEAFSRVPEQVDWTKMDGLIFVAEQVRAITMSRLPLGFKTVVIPNGVNFKKFPLQEQKVYGKKIAYVGYLNWRKNLGYLLACFEAIHSYDPEFTFHIVGQHQHPMIELFFNNLVPRLPFKITLDPWTDDVSGWLMDKDYILSTSYWEGTHCSIAEGIACGVLPLVYNWPGSEGVYPGSCFNTLTEMLNLLRRYQGAEDPRAIAKELHKDLENRLSLKQQLEDIDKFLMEVMK